MTASEISTNKIGSGAVDKALSWLKKFAKIEESAGADALESLKGLLVQFSGKERVSLTQELSRLRAQLGGLFVNGLRPNLQAVTQETGLSFPRRKILVQLLFTMILLAACQQGETPTQQQIDEAVASTPAPVTAVITAEQTTATTPVEINTSTPIAVETPTPAQTATPEPASSITPTAEAPKTPVNMDEILKQAPWEVHYTTSTSGELTAQYHNATSKEIVSVVAPEIENLQKSLWEAPDGRKLIIYQDIPNAHGLAKYRYPYNQEAGQYFPEGTIAWLEPKLLVNYPDGKAVRGGIVMVPEFQAQRQAQVPAAEKLQGKWRIGLPFTQAPSKTLNGEMVVGPWGGWSGILDIDFPPKDNAVVIVDPLSCNGLMVDHAVSNIGNEDIYIPDLYKNGFVPKSSSDISLSLSVSSGSKLHPENVPSDTGRRSADIGDILVEKISGTIHHPNGTTQELVVVASGPSGLWAPFDITHSFDRIGSAMVMTAPTAFE